MDYNLRNAFESIRQTRAACTRECGMGYSKEEIENTLTLETVLFIAYIISCDEITREDVAKLAFYTGFDLSVFDFYDIMRENGIDDNTFEYNVPRLLDIMVQLDNILIDNDAQIGVSQYMSLAYIQTFGYLAEEFYNDNGRINYDRRENWDVFQKTLTSYVDRNLHSVRSEYDIF